MATAEQVKALIRSHYRDPAEKFLTIALQIAAHEAGKGHSALAQEIREIVDKARTDDLKRNVLAFPQDLDGLIYSEEPEISFSSLVVNNVLRQRIERIVTEFRQQNKLKSHGLNKLFHATSQ